MVLGTVGYMSPEQVRGEAADPRSDIFSFGVVLYELLSGARPFIGDTAVQTMNAILTEDPPEIVTTGRPLPPALERVVRHCLEKKPDERFQSARDLAFALDALSSASSTSSGAVAAIEPVRRRLLPVLAAAGGIVAVVLAALAFFQPTDSAMDGHRLVPFSFESGGQSNAAWSPDGTVVAYSGAINPLDRKQVFIRYLDQPVARQLTDETEDCAVIGWMAGGKRILFRRGSSLFSVASVGGVPEPVLFGGDSTFTGSLPIALARQGDVLAAVRRGDDGAFSVWTSSPVGEPFVRYQPDPFADAERIANRQLSFSPDGRQMLLAMPSGDQGLSVWLMPYPANPAEPPRRVLADIAEISGMSWSPTTAVWCSPSKWTPSVTTDCGWSISDRVNGTRLPTIPVTSPRASSLQTARG
jgi:WD40 repeat protein